jgi:hypothetical protein
LEVLFKTRWKITIGVTDGPAFAGNPIGDEWETKVLEALK